MPKPSKREFKALLRKATITGEVSCTRYQRLKNARDYAIKAGYELPEWVQPTLARMARDCLVSTANGVAKDGHIARKRLE